MGANEISPLITKWLPLLGLHDWTIRFEFPDKPHTDGDGCEAEMSPSVEYLEGTLTIYPDLWDRPLEYIETVVVHELMHCKLSRLHEFLPEAGDKAMEEVTQTLAVAFVKLVRRTQKTYDLA
jgi:hypothetical protein